MKKLLIILFCVVSFESLYGMSQDGKESDNTYALYDAIYDSNKDTVRQLSHTTYRRSLSQHDIDLFIRYAGSDTAKVNMMCTACNLNLSPVWFAAWMMYHNATIGKTVRGDVSGKLVDPLLLIIKQLWDDTKDSKQQGPLTWSPGWCGTLLHFAAKFNLDDLTEWLVEQKKIDVDVRDAEKRTALCYAVKNGNHSSVRSLVTHGADVKDIGTCCCCSVPAEPMTCDDMLLRSITRSETYKRSHWIWSLFCCPCP